MFAFNFSGKIGVEAQATLDYTVGAKYSEETGIEMYSEQSEDNGFHDLTVDLYGMAELKVGIDQRVSFDILAGVLGIGLQAELGNYNIEVHNNFDHHSHSTSAGDCDFDPKKQPVRPWVYNRSFAIPDGSRRYEAKVDIDIPADIDTGDYHFMVRVTDKAGWQQLKAVSIKITDGAY